MWPQIFLLVLYSLCQGEDLTSNQSWSYEKSHFDIFFFWHKSEFWKVSPLTLLTCSLFSLDLAMLISSPEHCVYVWVSIRIWMFIRPRAAVTSAPPRVAPDVGIKTSKREKGMCQSVSAMYEIQHLLIQTAKNSLQYLSRPEQWEAKRRRKLTGNVKIVYSRRGTIL